MDFSKPVFAAMLRSKRAEADISQEELAEASGVSLTAIKLYESGSSGPLFETVCKLSKALGCTPNDLIGA